MGGLSELPRDPWWQVIGVFDDEGEGRDFAYTVGLAERGLPELHIAARPSRGEDPGADWRFSISDLAGILNATAWRLLDGRIATGDAWEEEFDAGLVTVRFVLDPPEAAEPLEAFQAGDVPVHPVRWSLHREPEGPLTPLSPEQLAVAGIELDELRAALGPDPAPLPGWELPAEAGFAPEQRWGPRTPIVLARGVQLRQMTAADLVQLLNVAMALSFRRMTSYAVVVALSAARTAGRTAALERLVQDADDLVGQLGVTWGHEAWAAALEWVNGDDEEPLPDDRVREIVAEVVRPFLLTVAAQDLLSTDMVVFGAGPVVCAFSHDGHPPSPAWHAADHVVTAVRELAVLAGAEGVAAAAAAWAEAEGDEAAGARGDVAVHAVTSPSMFPPWRQELPAGLVRELRRRERRDDLPEWVIQDWLTTLTTVLSHRAALEPETVDLVIECGEGWLPGLGRLVNDPLTVG